MAQGDDITTEHAIVFRLRTAINAACSDDVLRTTACWDIPFLFHLSSLVPADTFQNERKKKKRVKKKKMQKKRKKKRVNLFAQLCHSL